MTNYTKKECVDILSNETGLDELVFVNRGGFIVAVIIYGDKSEHNLVDSVANKLGLEKVEENLWDYNSSGPEYSSDHYYKYVGDDDNVPEEYICSKEDVLFD